MSQFAGHTVTYRDRLTGGRRQEAFVTGREAEARAAALSKTAFADDIKQGTREPLNPGAAQWMRYKEFEEGYR